MKFDEKMFVHLKNGGKIKLCDSHHPHKYIHIVKNDIIDDKCKCIDISLEDVLFSKTWKYVDDPEIIMKKEKLNYTDPREFTFEGEIYEFETKPIPNDPISMILGRECSNLYINTTLIDPRPKKKSRWIFKMFELID